MTISSGFALLIDSLATLLCQSGYVLQKKGHMSVESHNASTNENDNKKSGFITCIWAIGFGMSCIAGILHASKFYYTHPALSKQSRHEIRIY